ncbi:transposase family protein [Plesiomonas shigelloides]|uniref:transposase family protein n=1 Tax=Plesiomonas shigelloides TaxID=703 RepID=UPI00396A391B
MFQVVTTMLCGMKTWDDIEVFGEENLTWFRKFSDYAHGVPSHDTLARIVGLVDQGKIMNMPVFKGFAAYCYRIRKRKIRID